MGPAASWWSEPAPPLRPEASLTQQQQTAPSDPSASRFQCAMHPYPIRASKARIRNIYALSVCSV